MTKYIPMLRFKRGELTALSHLQNHAKKDVLPYFDVSADRFRGRRETKKGAAVSAPNHIANQIINSWGNQPCFIDASKVSVQVGPPHPIQAIYNAVNQLGGNIMPATTFGASAAYQKTLAALHTQHGIEVGLRIDFAEFNSVTNWVSTWPIPLAQTHLILDLADNVSNVLALGPVAVNAFQTLVNGNQWASITVVGTSIPETFTGYNQGIYDIDRNELALWQSLTKGGLPYQLNFGDYTTVSITAAPAQIRWGYPMTVKYTLEKVIKVCRGVRTTGPNAVDMKTQLLGHARSIVNLPNRQPLNGCWADIEIDQIAARKASTGNLERWVSLAVNRHIEKTRDQLP